MTFSRGQVPLLTRSECRSLQLQTAAHPPTPPPRASGSPAVAWRAQVAGTAPTREVGSGGIGPCLLFPTRSYPCMFPPHQSALYLKGFALQHERKNRSTTAHICPVSGSMCRVKESNEVGIPYHRVHGYVQLCAHWRLALPKVPGPKCMRATAEKGGKGTPRMAATKRHVPMSRGRRGHKTKGVTTPACLPSIPLPALPLAPIRPQATEQTAVVPTIDHRSADAAAATMHGEQSHGVHGSG